MLVALHLKFQPIAVLSSSECECGSRSVHHASWLNGPVDDGGGHMVVHFWTPQFCNPQFWIDNRQMATIIEWPNIPVLKPKVADTSILLLSVVAVLPR